MSGTLPHTHTHTHSFMSFFVGYYMCPGYMEDDEFINCDFVSTDVQRNKWTKQSYILYLYYEQTHYQKKNSTNSHPFSYFILTMLVTNRYKQAVE